jgi:hypothetical protein
LPESKEPSLASQEITIKRELWTIKKTGKKSYYSTARKNGRWVSTKKWHDKTTTEELKTYVVYIQEYPEEKYRKPIPREYRYDFKRTDIRPEKYVYLMQSNFGNEYRNYSMTSSQLYTMDARTKEYLFNMTKKTYVEEFRYPNEDHFDNLTLIKIYDSHKMETIRSY